MVSQIKLVNVPDQAVNWKDAPEAACKKLGVDVPDYVLPWGKQYLALGDVRGGRRLKRFDPRTGAVAELRSTPVTKMGDARDAVCLHPDAGRLLAFGIAPALVEIDIERDAVRTTYPVVAKSAAFVADGLVAAIVEAKGGDELVLLTSEPPAVVATAKVGSGDALAAAPGGRIVVVRAKDKGLKESYTSYGIYGHSWKKLGAKVLANGDLVHHGGELYLRDAYILWKRFDFGDAYAESAPQGKAADAASGASRAQTPAAPPPVPLVREAPALCAGERLDRARVASALAALPAAAVKKLQLAEVLACTIPEGGAGGEPPRWTLHMPLPAFKTSTKQAVALLESPAVQGLPVTRLSLPRQENLPPAFLQALLPLPGFAAIDGVDLRRCIKLRPALGPLLENVCGRLERLFVESMGLKNDDFAALGALDFPKLRILRVGMSSRTVNTDGLAGLFRGAFPALRELSLNDLEFRGQPGAQALAGSAFLSRLSRLDLQAWTSGGSTQGIRDAGIEILCASGKLGALRALDLAFQGISNVALLALARCPDLDLEELDLGDIHQLDVEGLGPLLASPATRHLRTLRLPAAKRRAAAIVCEASQLTGLRRLRLGWIDDEQARDLAARPHLAELEELVFGSEGTGGSVVSDQGGAAFAAGRDWRRLRRLTIVPYHPLVGEPTQARVGDMTVQEIARSFSGLVSLSLPSSHVTDRGLEALAGSPHLRRLEELDLSMTEIRTAAPLVEALPALRSLSLRHCDALKDGPRVAALAAERGMALAM